MTGRRFGRGGVGSVEDRAGQSGGTLGGAAHVDRQSLLEVGNLRRVLRL